MPEKWKTRLEDEAPWAGGFQVHVRLATASG